MRFIPPHSDEEEPQNRSVMVGRAHSLYFERRTSEIGSSSRSYNKRVNIRTCQKRTENLSTQVMNAVAWEMRFAAAQ
ncbi:hypothetical protein TNCV_2350561 [Trichonephila clavipes]|uniref:Uncharacterized protein n=1 Tax=Trichonephila clavipes TaxID=2585209 RepID=A0A8X6T102_TRICX|nr:hypothetical protein TNCV_2350561 [Trichonephila clavipes]